MLRKSGRLDGVAGSMVLYVNLEINKLKVLLSKNNSKFSLTIDK
jgi:hypothetical protein